MKPPESPVVLDTNVIVSAMLDVASSSGRALAAALSVGDLPFSEATWHELVATTTRRKFDRYLRADQRRKFLDILQPAAFVQIASKVSVCRDPSDDKILDVALAVLAKFVVTGDDDLLTMGALGDIAIVTPRTYVELARF